MVLCHIAVGGIWTHNLQIGTNHQQYGLTTIPVQPTADCWHVLCSDTFTCIHVLILMDLLYANFLSLYIKIYWNGTKLNVSDLLELGSFTPSVFLSPGDGTFYVALWSNLYFTRDVTILADFKKN